MSAKSLCTLGGVPDYEQLMADAAELEREADRLEAADSEDHIRFREALAKLQEIADRNARRRAS